MHGLNFQSTYTWSRNLGVTGTASNPLNRAFDYDLSPQHRSHTWTTYGTYNLPLGRNGYLFRDSPKWAQMIAEGWQLSWISSVTSGIPASVSTVASMFGGSAVDFVGPPGSFDSKGGEVTWENGSRSGLYYGDMYVHVDDPQCDSIAAGLQDRCREDLHALALASDPSVIVFQKAQPGSIGNFQVNRLTGPGRWSLDMAISKNIEFMEGKSINFRVDVNNIFNHPTPSGGAPQTYNDRDYSYGNPDFNLNSSDPFGYISHKGGHRVFSAKMRITF